jgi:hypothetical protein
MHQKNKNSTWSREGTEMMLSQDVSATRGVDSRPTTESWDPYDVWLTRVKQPRDRLPQRATLVVEAQASAPPSATAASPTEPLLLRGLS